MNALGIMGRPAPPSRAAGTSGGATDDAGGDAAGAVASSVAGGRPAAVRVNVEQASYAYGGRRHSAPQFTLEATTFEARERELVAILGPNASGKSTLLNLASGSIAPLSGRVELDGFETSRLDARTRAQRIAMVQQESALVFPTRAGDYVLQGRHPHGRSLWFEKDEDYEIAANALAQVGAEHLRDRWMHEISGGEKQRVVLAAAAAGGGKSLHRDRGDARIEPRGGIRRPHRAVASRKMFARRDAWRSLPARIARAGFRDSARDRGWAGRAASGSNPRQEGFAAILNRGPRADCKSSGVLARFHHGPRRAPCFTKEMCAAAAHTHPPANSAFGKTVRNRRRRATVRRRQLRASHCPAGSYQANRMGRPRV